MDFLYKPKGETTYSMITGAVKTESNNEDVSYPKEILTQLKGEGYFDFSAKSVKLNVHKGEVSGIVTGWAGFQRYDRLLILDASQIIIFNGFLDEINNQNGLAPELTFFPMALVLKDEMAGKRYESLTDTEIEWDAEPYEFSLEAELF